ncbi:hypothetical protein [Endothiovibrio diazotrophicus]
MGDPNSPATTVLRADHGRFLALFGLLSLALLVALFDFDYAGRIDAYQVPRAAYFDTDRGVVPVSEGALRDTFLRGIERFEGGRRLVLIGNSVAAGAGAIDRGFLNARLAEGFDVINAALVGDYAGASASLAVVGIEAAERRRPAAGYDIVIVYPLARFYTGDQYWRSAAIHGLAEALKVERYVTPAKGAAAEGAAWWSRLLLGNMRCPINKSRLSAWIADGEPWCEGAPSREVRRPQWLRRHAAGVRAGMEPGEMGQVFWKQLAHYARDGVIENNVKMLGVSMGRLEAYLQDRGIPHRFSFLLIGAAPVAMAALGAERRGRLRALEHELLARIAAEHPLWRVEALRDYPDDDYFDVHHLNERGLARLAERVAAIGAGALEPREAVR